MWELENEITETIAKFISDTLDRDMAIEVDGIKHVIVEGISLNLNHLQYDKNLNLVSGEMFNTQANGTVTFWEQAKADKTAKFKASYNFFLINFAIAFEKGKFYQAEGRNKPTLKFNRI